MVVLAAIAGLVYSGYSWKQNRDLQSDLNSQKSQIQSLAKQVKSLKATISENSKPSDTDEEEVTPNTPITGKVGTTIATKGGGMLIATYTTSSRHAVVSAYTSVAPILEVDLKLTNTTSTNQTYNADQFTLINSASTILNTMHREFMNMEVPTSSALDTITLAPGGSVTTKVYFDSYDSKQSTFIWNSPSGQQVKTVLPSL